MRPDGPRPSIVGPDSGPAVPFPVKVGGEVVSGFGRGSKELGIPTANIPISGLSVGGYSDIESGVYFGWAGLSPPPPSADSKTPAADGTHTPSETFAAGFEIYPMVMSIGWNPFYKNTVRSVEVHIMHKFAKDFYGAQMNLLILGFIRPEYDYVSKESLIDDINIDIEVAKKSLAREAWEELRADEFLRSTGSEQSKG